MNKEHTVLLICCLKLDESSKSEIKTKNLVTRKCECRHASLKTLRILKNKIGRMKNPSIIRSRSYPIGVSMLLSFDSFKRNRILRSLIKSKLRRNQVYSYKKSVITSDTVIWQKKVQFFFFFACQLKINFLINLRRKGEWFDYYWFASHLFSNN